MLSTEFEKSSYIDKQRHVIYLPRKDDLPTQYWKVYNAVKIVHCIFIFFSFFPNKWKPLYWFLFPQGLDEKDNTKRVRLPCIFYSHTNIVKKMITPLTYFVVNSHF